MATIILNDEQIGELKPIKDFCIEKNYDEFVERIKQDMIKNFKEYYKDKFPFIDMKEEYCVAVNSFVESMYSLGYECSPQKYPRKMKKAFKKATGRNPFKFVKVRGSLHDVILNER